MGCCPVAPSTRAGQSQGSSPILHLGQFLSCPVKLWGQRDTSSTNMVAAAGTSRGAEPDPLPWPWGSGLQKAVPPQTSGVGKDLKETFHASREKGLCEPQAGCGHTVTLTQENRHSTSCFTLPAPRQGDSTVTRASTFCTLPGCPSHLFLIVFQEGCCYPHLTKLTQGGLKCPRGQQLGLGMHLAPGQPASVSPTTLQAACREARCRV